MAAAMAGLLPHFAGEFGVWSVIGGELGETVTGSVYGTCTSKVEASTVCVTVSAGEATMHRSAGT